MNSKLNRRQFGGLVGGASLAVLASAGRSAFAADSVRLIWWGNPERDKRTYAVAELYQEMTGTEVIPETYSWGDYWTKLGTLAAGGDLPDVIQMDYRYITEYARRGQLAAMDEFIGNELELDDFAPSALESGKVDDKVYGISMGSNTMSYVYNADVFNELGLDMGDPTKFTTEDFTAMGKSVKDKLPDRMFFMSNKGREENALQTFTRQRGKDLYTADGQLAFELEDLVDFWDYWKMMLDEGLTPPADVEALNAGKMDEMMMVTHRSLFDFLHSNQLVACQNLADFEVNMTLIPTPEGGRAGQYMKPSMLLSMAGNSPDKSAAAKLLNFFITAPEANDILLIERGVTGDASIRERITAALTPTEAKIIEYLNVAATHVSPLPPAPPKGAGEIDRAVEPAWDAIAFGQKSVADAAQEFYDFARTTLERA